MENEPPVALPPPGGGFLTPICTWPAVRIKASGTVAVNTVVDENVVGIGVPSIVMEELFRKFVPFTVNSTDVPMIADEGVKPLIVGAGLRMLTVNVALPPPGEGVVIDPVNVPAFCV